MSIQSDVELLSVRTMEEYAKRNHLSTLSAIEIFHKYQVFEKMYMSGILNTSEAVERLRYNQVNNQISFHTERALEYLKFIRRERYE